MKVQGFAGAKWTRQPSRDTMSDGCRNDGAYFWVGAEWPYAVYTTLNGPCALHLDDSPTARFLEVGERVPSSLFAAISERLE